VSRGQHRVWFGFYFKSSAKILRGNIRIEIGITVETFIEKKINDVSCLPIIQGVKMHYS
jgi:hypothetical protein